MTQLTPAEQELIRTRPQFTRLNLFVFRPTTIFQAQINNGSIARGDRTIAYDNVTLGSYLSIEANFTLLVGTTPGAQDVGRIRVRSATASQLVVSENNNIAWADNLYLTVLRYVELWPIYPRIIQDPADPEDVIFYKDYDIAYTNQNTLLGTFVCMGPHRPVLRESNGTGTVWYSATGTFNVKGESLTFNWAFEGGNPTGSTARDPGYVAYNTPGNYVTRLVVTSSGGATDTSYRYVAVRDSVERGSNTPIVKWTMEELSGSRQEGGHTVSLTVHDDLTLDDNAVVMILSDDWFGDTHQSLGGNYPNASSIFFVGVVDKSSIEFNYQESYVSFDAVSLTKLMKDAVGFSVSVESVAVPSTWYELLDMDVRRALYHYLRWHSTIQNIADFQFVGTDYPIQYFDSDRTSMFDAIDNLMRGTLHGQLTSDRQGKLWAEVDAMAYSNPTGSFPSNFDISKRDWKDTPDIQQIFADEFSYVELNGIAYSGVVTGTYAPLIACAPGEAPSFRGKVEKKEGLALGGQSQLNSMVGNVFANRNSRFPRIDMRMGNSLRNLDIAPQETNRIIITPSDTAAGISIDRLYIPERIIWRYDAKGGLLLPNVSYQNVLTGMVGTTIPMPDLEEITGGGFNIGNINIPNIPPFNPFTTTNVLGAIKFNATAQVLNPGADFGSARLFLPSFVVGDVFLYSSATGTFATNITAARTGLYLITSKQHTEGTMVGSGGGTSNFVETGVIINGSLGFPNSQRVSLGSTVAPSTVGYDVDIQYGDVYYLIAGDTVGAYYQAASNTVSEILVALSAVLLYAV